MLTLVSVAGRGGFITLFILSIKKSLRRSGLSMESWPVSVSVIISLFLLLSLMGTFENKCRMDVLWGFSWLVRGIN
jgi:hypothetical protein